MALLFIVSVQFVMLGIDRVVINKDINTMRLQFYSEINEKEPSLLQELSTLEIDQIHQDAVEMSVSWSYLFSILPGKNSSRIDEEAYRAYSLAVLRALK